MEAGRGDRAAGLGVVQGRAFPAVGEEDLGSGEGKGVQLGTAAGGHRAFGWADVEDWSRRPNSTLQLLLLLT
jgi:hypothetical protein